MKREAVDAYELLMERWRQEAESYPKWDKRFVALAAEVASWSKDTSTKVGCVIVGPNREIRTTGYNGLPRGADDNNPARDVRPEKYKWYEHAERNAIYNAARVGVPLEGCTIYLTWFPCMDCARAIVQSGIKTLVSEEPDWNHERFGEDFLKSAQLFSETGVTVRWVK